MQVLSPKLWLVFNEPAHYCPGCKALHRIDVNAPNKYTGARWTWDGNVQAPTFNPSINIVGHCHYFVRDGQLQYCSDSKHALAGQTIPLPDIPDDERDWIGDSL